MAIPSLQERVFPAGRCFGCGPANERGLRLRSYPESSAAASPLVATWTPEPHHSAFEGVLNGGILGTLLDCHSNATALHHLWRRDQLEGPPCTVTYDFHVKMKHPTPTDQTLRLTARPVESDGDWVTVEAEVEVDGVVTATCRGRFVRVHPGHPAFQAW